MESFLDDVEEKQTPIERNSSEFNEQSQVSFGEMTHTPIQLTWRDVKVHVKQKNRL